ncbi:MAG: fatty acid desaturase [Spirochaetaceae bacterium]|nr:MAG: fatty acid desaturase [Spirochaetaceae bacterium]
MKQKIDWYRTPLEQDLLKTLTGKSDLRGLLQAGSFLLIYLGTIYLAYFFFARGMWIPMILASYLHCTFHSFIGTEAAVHELSHGTPFKTRFLNEFFYRLFSFLTWNNYLHFRVSHMLHHQYTVHKGLDKGFRRPRRLPAWPPAETPGEPIQGAAWLSSFWISL